jgi:hypothetical protein
METPGLYEGIRDGIILSILGMIVADFVFNHYDHGHYRTDQRIYDREFKDIVDNYHV